jgi:hypothetical protein
LASNGTFRSCVNDGPISDGVLRKHLARLKNEKSQMFPTLGKRLRVDGLVAHHVEAGVRSRSSSVHNPKENLDQRRLHDHRLGHDKTKKKKRI